ncbi:MAG: PLP-dependent aminotransferase family protein [Anaerolineae bacterium]|nr:PLP-dependent aminotransferase family protein [Anaerolineae bacterium]NUQ05816.1 PLP-dependent aminotransferase family protein [Anaerolineae bacterium]
MLPGEFNIVLDRDSEEPIYRQLIRFIRSQVDSGGMPAGTRLPASRDLAHQLDISRISVVNAYAELRAEGYLSAHAGRGTFVAGERTPPPEVNGHNGRHNHHSAELPITPDRSIREMMRLARKPGVINFSTGAPPIEFFPVQHLRDAINTILDRDSGRALSYEVAEGYGPLRASVRDYVSALGIRCSAEQVMITGGTQQAIDLVVQAICCEGDLLVSESPTYLGLIDIARTRRLNIQGVPMDDDGIRLDILENLILESRPRLIYSMPTFQNPTGGVMSLHRRRQLLNLAGEYGVPILEDGVYHEFRFEGEALPPLKALDDSGIVIHASGFTKNLLPGMRIGYVIANNHHHERLVRVKQAADISTPGLNQRAIHLLLERGVLAQQLERNNRELRRRRDAALDAAARCLPSGARWTEPLGGYYLWVELPRSGPTAAELYIAAIQTGVAYAIGSVFFPNGGGGHQLRINFGAQKPADIEEGFRRLGHAWRELTRDYADIEKTPLM